MLNLPKRMTFNFGHHFVCENRMGSSGEITCLQDILYCMQKMATRTIDKCFPVHIFLKNNYPVSSQIIEIIWPDNRFEIIHYIQCTQAFSFDACDRTRTHPHTHGTNNACERSHALSLDF